MYKTGSPLLSKQTYLSCFPMKYHSKINSFGEMVLEYKQRTAILLRMWGKKANLGGDGE